MHNQSSFHISKESIMIGSFSEIQCPYYLLIFKSKMVKLPDEIKIENCLFITKYVNNKLPPIFDSMIIILHYLS